MRLEHYSTGGKQVQKEVPGDSGEAAVAFEELLVLAKQRDQKALEEILSHFENDIHALSRKAKYIGIPEDEARQFLLMHFIELLVEGNL